MSKPIKNFLTAIFAPSDRWKLRLLSDWSQLAGSLQGKILIERIENNILYLKVGHPAWAQELLFLMPMLKKKINAHLGQEYIERIYVKCIQHKAVVAKPMSVPARQPVEYQHEMMFDSHQQRMLALLKSDQLQSILSSYFAVCKKNAALKKGKKEKDDHDGIKRVAKL